MRSSKPVFRLTLTISILMFGGVLWLIWTMPVFAQPPIPHSVEGRDDCLACHNSGLETVPQIPEDHDGRTNEMCQGCHQQAISETAPAIPHTLEGRENCTACHMTAQLENESVQPAATSITIATPVFYANSSGQTNTCIDCHSTLEGRSAQVVSDWQSSIHAERGVSCASCHGGNPGAAGAEESMSVEAGYVGRPDRAEIPALCGSCHANITMMRQYSLPTDQLAKYNESFHGQQLAMGDMKVATCYDCHDQHGTRQTNDPQSHVYILNVPELCATCHANEAYMAEYDIRTDQYEAFASSVHGVALLEHQDVRAPNCATCHGTHGAAPPGFDEVANVCGSCHSATQNYFVAGAHSSDNADAPRCITCHGHHAVQWPSEALFLDNDPHSCGTCHAADSEEGTLVAEIQHTISEADERLAEAQELVERTASLGMIVTEEEQLLTEAYTRLVTARAAQHAVNLDVVLEESNPAIELSETVRQQAEGAMAENVSRRQAMVVVLAIIGVVIFSLVMVRRKLHQ